MAVSVGKWTKYNVMKKDPWLAQAVPPTQLLTYKTFQLFLNRYREVFLKPSVGEMGAGVVHVRAGGGGKRIYEFHSGNRRVMILGTKRAYNYFCRYLKVKGKRYIIQQKVNLLKINNCPFDFRVMVQRKNVNSPWSVTAIAAKVAARHYVTTNVAAKVLTFEEAIRQSSLYSKDLKALEKEVKSIALRTASVLQKKYPHHRRFGIDMGIDYSGKVWIIEANYRGSNNIFLFLKDKAMYERVLEYDHG
ncbi:YheC/YheD family protein [Salipaludibacillus sp. CUR1]|uniref:YheC/YheD family protein n=1 Tax=Salipaludibacillus sp. CUR1 TaxID=2820003 RepID=UPI001E2BE9A6|nr:YheC/YheD family protein [Salipaludibacillus sp. CUR1]MCE7794416.1 YheC/YheD family protein [Salipaludibacillus sp. CUR1]